MSVNKDPIETWLPFGAVVRQLIDDRYPHHKDFAAEIGWAPSKVSNIVQGKVAPRDLDLLDLERAFPGNQEELRTAFEACKTGAGSFSQKDSGAIARALQPFLIRAEVRMSTLHRTALGILGTTSVMLLLPLIFPTAPTHLLGAAFDVHRVSLPATILLTVAMGITLGLPIWGLILVIGDLTGFYFTGHRFDVRSDDGTEAETVVFNPRLGLPGLLSPSNEIPIEASKRLDRKRDELLGVLLPPDEAWKEGFDARMRSIFHLNKTHQLTDQSRRAYAFRLTVSVQRTLIEETAKIELSLAKHILVLRVAVMRFIKTLLLVAVTVITVVLADSLVATAHTVTLKFVELLGTFLLWGPIAVGAVGSPNRWIQRMSPGVGDVRQVYDDPRMVRYENGVVFLALVSGALLIVAVGFLAASSISNGYRWALFGLVGAFLTLWIIAKTAWWKGYLRRTPRAFFRMLKVGAH